MTLCAAAVLHAQSQPTLVVSSETAPPGGWAQFKIYSAQPILDGSAILSMDFDPAVFGDVTQVAAFSSFGDAIGYAHVSGKHTDLHFNSALSGLGQLPELPIAVVTVAVNSGTAAGKKVQVTLNASATGVDPGYYAETFGAVTIVPGQFTVGGSLSVESVTPGYGLQPGGTVLQIRGAGFTAGTTVSADGVSLAAVAIVSPQELNVTLGGATDLLSKHFHVTDGNASVDFFSAPPSAPSQPLASTDPFANVQALFPLTVPFLYTCLPDLSQTLGRGGLAAYALLNGNASQATLTLQGFSYDNTISPPQTFDIPPYSVYLLNASQLSIPAQIWLNSSLPISMLSLYDFYEGPPLPPNAPMYSTAVVPGAAPGSVTLQLSVCCDLSLSWQQGTPVPPPATVQVMGQAKFQVSVPASAPWLTVTPASGTGPATLTVTPNLASLKPGTYSTTISISPVLPPALAGIEPVPGTVNASLTVSAVPLLQAANLSFDFQIGSGPNTQTQPLPVTTNGNSTAFTVSAATSSGGAWLSVSPSSGTTPASLSVSAAEGNLPAGIYNGSITITSPQNTLTVPIEMDIFAPPGSGPLTANPTSLSFVVESGSNGNFAQLVVFQPEPSYVSTPAVSESWLIATVDSSGPNPAIQVSATAVGLAAGTYHGTVTVTSTTGNGSAQVPVTLVVTGVPTAQTKFAASPASISLTAPAGETASGSFTVTSGGTPVFFTVDFNNLPLSYGITGTCSYDGRCATPATIGFTVTGTQLGTHTGNFVIQWDTGSLTVPVSVIVTNAVSVAPPGTILISQVVNAASFTPGSLAPGEIMTVLGTSIGPYATGLEIGADGKVERNLNGTQLLINGIPTPLIYASINQLNAIVPYEVGTSGMATVQVIANGQQSAVWTVPLAGSAPAIFALNASGAGQGAILDQDNSINGPSNPAAPGSVIQIFATGEGVTMPPGVTGSITTNNLNKPELPVTVTIGGLDSLVAYAGSAPDEIEGLLQVNAVVPMNAPAGASVPIVLKVGDAQSPAGLTLAVK